jgi:hypothetical protein
MIIFSKLNKLYIIVFYTEIDLFLLGALACVIIYALGYLNNALGIMLTGADNRSWDSKRCCDGEDCRCGGRLHQNNALDLSFWPQEPFRQHDPLQHSGVENS